MERGYDPPMGGAKPEKQPWVDVPPELFASVYPVIAARRTAFDTLMWQVPTLGLAAQAFLLTIAYGSGSSQVARCVCGVLASVVAVVAIQTMLKHRANEKTDNLILERMERRAGIALRPGSRPHDHPIARAEAVGNDLVANRFTRGRSARLWIASLVCFGLGGVGAAILAVANPSLLSG